MCVGKAYIASSGDLKMLKMQLTKGMSAKKNCSYGEALAQERSYVTLQVAEMEGKDHPSLLEPR